MSEQLASNVEDLRVSPLGERILALFGWLNRSLIGDNSGAMALLPVIFEKSQEELDKELETLVELGLLAKDKPN